jgi:CRISPR-associated endonuclease Csn1
MKELDAALRLKWDAAAGHTERVKLTYRLRTAAVSGSVESFEMGRAIYHLAQRRGFLSNRKAPRKGDDHGIVEKEIGELWEKIKRHQPPTLGAYLNSLDPLEQRLRCRWTHREMYTQEFEAIWEEQARHHSLTDVSKREIAQAIFHQRPLKDQSHLIGRCELTGLRRAPLSLRIAQRFRMLQAVNHLQIVEPAPRTLTDGERTQLIEALCREGDLTFAAVRSKKVLGLPKGTAFNLERGGEKRLCGHRIDAKLREVFGERFAEISESEKDALVEDLRSIRSEGALRNRGVKHWQLPSEAADALAGIVLEEAHAGLSASAMQRLLTEMETGVPYSTARKKLYPASVAATAPRELLPPVSEWDGDLRNPTVARALTEMRKLVNAIIRRYGKPACIRIELARDLKQGRKRREETAQRMRERETMRERIKRRIVQEAGITQPSRTDVEKVMLADECNWRCPFTGRSFGMKELIGPQSQFDFEHIWPVSRSLDNSLLNKTICYHEENRQRKRGHTPFEAYSGTPEKYQEIVQRVRDFNGDAFTRGEKVRRFQAEQLDEDFVNRHLSDTRYIAAAASEYLGLLYGGSSDGQGKKRIHTPTGGATAWLRREWGLDKILGADGEKNRSDHRHHAVDALVIALTDDAQIKRLADAAGEAERLGKRRLFESMKLPWDGFLREAADAVEVVRVSHRQERKVRGKLHNDSLYSRPIGAGGKRRIRKELHKLSTTELKGETIVDARARKAILEKLAELKQENPAKAFADESNLPLVRGAGGQMVPLRKVRVEVREKPRTFGRGASTRYAVPAANHHTLIVSRLDKRGVEIWEDRPVRLSDLIGRTQADGGGKLPEGVKFSLAANDYIEMDSIDGSGRRLYRVLNLSKGDMELREHWDGRTQSDLKRLHQLERVSGGTLCKRQARKVRVSYLGEVFHAGG